MAEWRNWSYIELNCIIFVTLSYKGFWGPPVTLYNIRGLFSHELWKYDIALSFKVLVVRQNCLQNPFVAKLSQSSTSTGLKLSLIPQFSDHPTHHIASVTDPPGKVRITPSRKLKFGMLAPMDPTTRTIKLKIEFRPTPPAVQCSPTVFAKPNFREICTE